MASRRKGGVRQRLRAAEAEYPEARCHHSNLAELLLRRWSWGHISLVELQSIAAAALADWQATGLGREAPQQLQTLAALGGHGRQKNNLSPGLY